MEDMSNDRFYFAFAGSVEKGMDSICVVPVNFWETEHRKCRKYITNDKLADKIERIGFMECMENTFEFKKSKYSKEEVKKLLSSIGDIEYSQDFQDYLNKL
jgi:hypothetical protein